MQRTELSTFAGSKIRPPKFRAQLIDRPVLDARLTSSLRDHRLVLMVAPAGYGKTAMLSRITRALPPSSAFAWVTTDAEDNLKRLLRCLVEALEPYDLPWRVAPESLDAHPSQELGLRGAADEFLNALTATPVERGVIVLDDLHAVADARITEFLSLVLDGLPDNWTLAVGSRVEPALPLSRLRARREVAEFRRGDLNFTRDETERLCEAIALSDRDELAGALHERTEGWPAGISLSLDLQAAQRLAGARLMAARLSQRHLYDYLAAEVFDHMPEDLRDFLLSCSVLPELTARRCAQLTGNARAASLIEDIERRGLFVSELEGDELTLRLHDLFRDFLDDRLRKQHPGQRPALLMRAAEGEPDPARKVNYLLRAGAWPQAEAVFTTIATRMLQSGDSAHVVALIRQFPTQDGDRSPQLRFLRGQCAWLRNEYALMRDSMQEAAAGFDAAGQAARAQHARAYQALAMIYTGQLDTTRQLAGSVLAAPIDVEAEILGTLAIYWLTCIEGPALEPGRHLDRLVDLLTASGRNDLWTICTTTLYVQIDRAGVTAPAERLVRAASRVVASGDVPLRAALHAINTKLQLMRGQVDEAEASLDRLREEHAWLGAPASLSTPLQWFTTWHQTLRGDGEAARASAMAVSYIPSSDEKTPSRTWIASLRYFVLAQTAIATQDWASLRFATQGLHGTEREAEWPVIEGRRMMARGMLALHEGRMPDALVDLRAAVAVAERLGGLGKDATERIALARAELRDGSPEAAWKVVAPLVRMASAQGLIGVLMLQGPDALEELLRGIATDVAPAEDLEFVARAAQAARDARRNGPSVAPTSPAQLQSHLLTAREMEVLERMATGESNKVIARALHLSPHTVKRHVAHILARLEVSTRGQASAWYARLRTASETA